MTLPETTEFLFLGSNEHDAMTVFRAWQTRGNGGWCTRVAAWRHVGRGVHKARTGRLEKKVLTDSEERASTLMT